MCARTRVQKVNTWTLKMVLSVYVNTNQTDFLVHVGYCVSHECRPLQMVKFQTVGAVENGNSW